MEKFKVGDKVRCIKSEVYIESRYSNKKRGHGWRDGLVFRINKITYGGYCGVIYWGGYCNAGVYESYLELFSEGWNDINEQINKIRNIIKK